MEKDANGKKEKVAIFTENGFDQWGGYMQAKITKLEEQFVQNARLHSKSNLFHNVSIFVNGLTNPSADELKKIMLENGGIYHTYPRSHTTYFIASNLPDIKIRQQFKLDKTISPQWVVDSLKSNRIMDYKKYLLYTNSKQSQPKLMFDQSNKKKDVSPESNNDICNMEINNDKLNVIKMETAITNQESSIVNVNQDLQHGLDILNKQLKNNSIALSSNTECITSVNSIVKNNSNVLARTACDPNFLKEFLQNSRLHHIATLGSDFKDYVVKLRENHNGVFIARNTLSEDLQNFLNRADHSSDSEIHKISITNKIVMHIDMDCFFVSVGLRLRPELRGLPVAVTHSKGRNSIGQNNNSNTDADVQKEIELYRKRLQDKLKDNINDDRISDYSKLDNTDSLAEIASCSYEARKMGIKNGMFVGMALKLCPNLITIPYDFDGYKEVADTLYSTIAKYTLDIEAVSCDEMYVDLTEIIKQTNVPINDFLLFLRHHINDQTGCTCSTGVGVNKLQARMATKQAKPNGQFILVPELVQDYFSKILITDLPGVGNVTTHKCNQLKWYTCEDLQMVSLQQLQKEFGIKTGETLYQFCRGIDNRPLCFEYIRKSVSVEVNYGIRFTENSELEYFLNQLCIEVHSRLLKAKRKTKAITLKLMIRAVDAPVEPAKFMGHGYCDNLTKTITLSEYTNDLNIIYKTIISIKNTIHSNLDPKELRGIGIHLAKFDSVVNQSTSEKQTNTIENMFDKMKEKKVSSTKDIEMIDIDQPLVDIPNVSTININDHSSGDKPSPRITRSKTNSLTRKPMVSTTKKVSSLKRPVKAGGGNTVANMFRKQQDTSLSELKEIDIYDGIDMTTFVELPEEIQQEIINERKKEIIAKMVRDNPSERVNNREKVPIKKKTKGRKIQKKNPINNDNTNIEFKDMDSEFLAAMPPDILEELRIQYNTNNNDAKIKKKTDGNTFADGGGNIEVIPVVKENELQKICDENILVRDNWRIVLQSWLNSTSEPLDCDIEIICKYFSELIWEKSFKWLDRVELALRFLHRVINEHINCAWHTTYLKIINSVQAAMLVAHDCQLLVSTNFSCIIDHQSTISQHHGE